VVRGVEVVKKRTLWGYKGDDWLQFIKITVDDPKNLPKVRDECFLYPFFDSTANNFSLGQYGYSNEPNAISRAYSKTSPPLSKATLRIPYAL
jgi:hypothetical protein